MGILTLDLARRLLPYLLAAAAGAYAAWWVQGIRLDRAEATFEQYKLDQREAIQKQRAEADKRRDATDKEWSEKYARLQEDTEIYKRCVAAGKCGVRHVSVRVPNMPPDSGLAIQAAGVLDAARPDAIPAPRGGSPDEEMIQPVLKDCATTTLMLNLLQADIERQQ